MGPGHRPGRDTVLSPASGEASEQTVREVGAGWDTVAGMGRGSVRSRTVRGSLLRAHPTGPGLQPPALPSLQRKEFKSVPRSLWGPLRGHANSQKAGRPRGQSESAHPSSGPEKGLTFPSALGPQGPTPPPTPLLAA